MAVSCLLVVTVVYIISCVHLLGHSNRLYHGYTGYTISMPFTISLRPQRDEVQYRVLVVLVWIFGLNGHGSNDKFPWQVPGVE